MGLFRILHTLVHCVSDQGSCLRSHNSGFLWISGTKGSFSICIRPKTGPRAPCCMRERAWWRRKRRKHLQLHFACCLLARTHVGRKTFICLREVLQLSFSRDAFPPAVIYNLDGTILLSAKDGPLCKKQMHDLWSQKDRDSVAHLMGLWENSAGFWDLFPVLVCVYFM